MRFLLPDVIAHAILASLGFSPRYSGDTLTLPTGAKLFWDTRSGGWGIYGYNADHSDVARYYNLIPNDAPSAPF